MTATMTNIEMLATSIAKCCGQKCVAEILNGLLSAEVNPMLNDMEAEAAQQLFDALADANPKAVLLAQSM